MSQHAILLVHMQLPLRICIEYAGSKTLQFFSLLYSPHLSSPLLPFHLSSPSPPLYLSSPLLPLHLSSHHSSRLSRHFSPLTYRTQPLLFEHLIFLNYHHLYARPPSNPYLNHLQHSLLLPYSTFPKTLLHCTIRSMTQITSQPAHAMAARLSHLKWHHVYLFSNAYSAVAGGHRVLSITLATTALAMRAMVQQGRRKE